MHFVVCSDSQAVLHALSGPRLDSCGFLRSILILLSDLSHHCVGVSFQWVPSHCGIVGNEQADRLAQQAHDLPYASLTPVPLIGLKREASKTILEACNLRWRFLSSITHLGLIKNFFHPLPCSGLGSRRFDVVVTRLRLGHCGLRDHLHRLKLVSSPNCISCSVPETPEHFLLQCQRFNQFRCTLRTALRPHNVDLTLQNLLGGGGFSPHLQILIYTSLERYLRATGYFHSL